MEYSTILVKKEEGIATVTLNRPHRRNAINDRMLEEFSDALVQLNQDDGIKVVILTGTGADFCVGGDVKGDADAATVLDEADPETSRRHYYLASHVTYLLATIDKPTIAMINGVAAGGGFDWAVACDLRIASEKARFRSYMQIGLIPEEGAWFMTRLMGYGRAAEMFFTADIWDVNKAERAGLLNRVVPPENLERETMEIARRIASNSPTAVRLGKLLLRKSLELGLQTTLDMGFALSAVCTTSRDFKEGIVAFREKRQPRY